MNIEAIFTGLGCPTQCCLDEENQPEARFGYPVPRAGGRSRAWPDAPICIAILYMYAALSSGQFCYLVTAELPS